MCLLGLSTREGEPTTTDRLFLVPGAEERQGARYSKEILTLYANEHLLFRVLSFPFLPLRIKLIPQVGLNTWATEKRESDRGAKKGALTESCAKSGVGKEGRNESRSTDAF